MTEPLVIMMLTAVLVIAVVCMFSLTKINSELTKLRAHMTGLAAATHRLGQQIASTESLDQSASPVATVSPVTPAWVPQPVPQMAPPAPQVAPPVYAATQVGPQLASAKQGAKPRMLLSENFVGRNLLPILAAVLGLVGLVFLGILVVPHLSETVRVVLMFVISFAVAGLGYWLTARHSTVLTRALLGTGVGGVFISVLVTHMVFRKFSDIVSFSLLAFLIVGSMWLAKHVNSLLIAILAHAGMVASIATALLIGMNDDSLLMLLGYQTVATIAIIVANVIWVRTMYRFGLFASQAMIIMCSAAMWFRFMRDAPGFDSTLAPGWIVAAFIVQFVGATVIAYLLFVSCARLKSRAAAGWLSALNIAMWACVLISSVTVLMTKLIATQMGQPVRHVWYYPLPFWPALVVTLVLAFLPVLLAAVLESRLGLKPQVMIGTMVTSAVVSAGLLLVNAAFYLFNSFGPSCAWISGLAAAYLVLAWRTKSSTLAWIGRVVLAIDALLMLSRGMGYASITEFWNVWASLGYLVVLLGLAWFAWHSVPSDLKTRVATGVLVMVFLVAVASLYRIAITSDINSIGAFFCLGVALGLGVVRLRAGGRADIFFRVAEFLTILHSAQIAYFLGQLAYLSGMERGIEKPTVGIIMVSVAVAVLIAVLLDRIRVAAKASSYAIRMSSAPRYQSRLEILSGAGLTVAVVGLFSPYQWFLDGYNYRPWGYPTSLACMGVALLCVGLGLWSRVKPLRLYGLVVVLVCVLKLVVFDIGVVSPVTRVVAFLGGAAICFGISALYNYTARLFDKELAEEIPEEVVIPAEAIPQ